MRILYVSNVLPVSAASGSQNVSLALLEFLRWHGANVHVCYTGASERDFLDHANVSDAYSTSSSRLIFARLPLARSVPKEVTLGASRFARKAAKVCLRILGFAPSQRTYSYLCGTKSYCDLPDELDRQHVQKLIAARNPDVMLVDYAWQAELLDFRPPGATGIILTHDLVFQRRDAFLSIGAIPDVPDWDRKTESAYLRKADIVLIEREGDRLEFEDLAPKSEVIVAPLALHPRVMDGCTKRGRCIFVGGVAPHNVDGLRWFLRHVWPLVLTQTCGATLHICGRIHSAFENDELKLLPGLNWRGAVDDLADEYSQAEVAIAPVLAGSGLKTKVIEALSFGVPVVATVEGAAGITDASAVSVAEDVEKFAARIGELLGDDSRKAALRTAALDYVRSRLSPEALYGPIVESIERRRTRAAQTRTRSGEGL